MGNWGYRHVFLHLSSRSWTIGGFIMALYKLTGNDSLGEKIQAIVRTTDKASIPIDNNNKDYQDYLAWVAEGNTAEAAD